MAEQPLPGSRTRMGTVFHASPLDQRVIGEIGIGHERADAQAPVRRLLDGLERQARDVDQLRRARHLVLHQVDQVGAAGDEFRSRIGCNLSHGVGDVGCPRVLEVDHDRPITCWIAARMLG